MSDDFSPDTSTTGRLIIGTPTVGDIPYFGSPDWLKVSLDANTGYIFNLVLRSFYSGAGIGVGLALHDASGKMVTSMAYAGDNRPFLHFTAPLKGDYFLSVTGVDRAISYQVNAVVHTPDPIASDTSTTGAIVLGSQVAATFEVAGDRDWFRFEAQLGQHIAFGSLAATDTTVQVSGVQIYDAQGQRLDTFRNTFEPFVSGTYFVSAESTKAGNYTLTSTLRTDDYSANASTVGLLVPGGPAVSGKIDYQRDLDRMKLSMLAGQVYEVRLTGAAADMAGMTLKLAPYAGLSVLQWTTRGADGSITLGMKPAIAGDYYIDVEGPSLSGAGPGTAPYLVSALAPKEDDFGDTEAGAGRMDLGIVLPGSLHRGPDVDFAAIELLGGKTYAVEASAPGANYEMSTSIVGPGEQSYGPLYGSKLAYYTFTAASSGTYYLRTSQGSGASNSQDYTVKISAVVDDRSASAIGAGSFSANGSPVTGLLERGGGDRDWFGIDLKAGTTYWFNFAGIRTGLGDTDLGSPASMRALVKVFDASGTLLSSTLMQDYVSSQIVPFVPGANGKYYVEVSDPSHYYGSYTLSAALGQVDDHGNTPAAASLLVDAVPVTIQFELPTDRDVFKLSATAGKTYVMVTKQAGTSGSSGAYMGGFELQARDPSGEVVYINNLYNHFEKYQYFTPTVSGDYFLTASTGSANIITYSMQVHAVSDDVPAPQGSPLLQENSAVSGRIDYHSDVDFIKVPLVAGHSYVFQLLGSRSAAGSIDMGRSGPSFTLTADGYDDVEAQPVPGSAEPTIRFTATATSDYYLKVKVNDSTDGSYTVKSTTTTFDQAGPLVVGGLLPGATNVGLAGDLTLQFNEAVRVVGDITLRDSKGIVTIFHKSWLMEQAGPSDYVLKLDPSALLQPGMTYTVDLGNSNLQDLAGNGFGQTFSFSTVPAKAAGSAGDDYLSVAGINVRIDGGAGLDSVFYPDGTMSLGFTRSGSDIVFKSRNTITGTDSSDTLLGVERVFFKDRSAVALDIDGVGGQAYRLYRAAFDRMPDEAGVGYWMSVMDQGLSLTAVAQGFVDSAEFKTLYGAASSDADFIGRLYANVLHRPLDQAGADYWTQALAKGFTRADVLAFFSESAENQNALIGLIGNGFFYLPYH